MTDALRRFSRLVGIGAATLLAGLGTVSVADAAPAKPADVGADIVGGQDADIADYPFTVALTTPNGEQFCGGTLAAANKVVTAAHCMQGESPENLRVVSGRTAMSSNEGTVSEVSDIWVHPDYQDATQGFDVAVVTLAGNVQEQPIELATADDPGYNEGTEATILGWGTTSEGGNTSDTLQQANVPVNSDQDCSSAYQEYNPDAMVCAGLPEGGVDSCQGDSGGPMVAGGKLIGVTSWGEGCARPGKPGIYARVGAYHDVLTEPLGGSSADAR
ncbi:MAG: trypsin-like serine protease [Pseudonocardiaceae bacterium]|nr:trypsin-like serine protease [Pseudonocardiaceae bacterium]